MRCGVAVDLGTSGYRAQKIDLDKEEIRRTVITLRNPLPGANVMDHMDFAIHYGQDLAHGLSINAVKNLFQALDVKSEELERLFNLWKSNPAIHFPGNKHRRPGLCRRNERKKSTIYRNRTGVRELYIAAKFLGLDEYNCEVVVPPAIKHEVGADALP